VVGEAGQLGLAGQPGGVDLRGRRRLAPAGGRGDVIEAANEVVGHGSGTAGAGRGAGPRPGRQVGLGPQPHGGEAGLELGVAGVRQQVEPGGDLVAGVVEPSLPHRQLGQGAVEQAVEPAVAHLVAPRPRGLQPVAGQVVVAAVDGERAGHQRPGDRGEPADIGRWRPAQQSLGVVPSAELSQGGGGDDARQ
jgi:hypothetical protein